MIEVEGGAVSSVWPDNPQTRAAIQAAQKGTVVDAINKLAESGWRLLEGSVIVGQTSLAGAFVTFFMYREV